MDGGPPVGFRTGRVEGSYGSRRRTSNSVDRTDDRERRAHPQRVLVVDVTDEPRFRNGIPDRTPSNVLRPPTHAPSSLSVHFPFRLESRGLSDTVPFSLRTFDSGRKEETSLSTSLSSGMQRGPPKGVTN